MFLVLWDMYSYSMDEISYIGRIIFIIYTPRHYSRNMKTNMYLKIIWIKMFTILVLLEMIFHWTQSLVDLLCVLAHIYMTDIYANKSRNNKLEENIDTPLF
jgi:hypothetical protein